MEAPRSNSVEAKLLQAKWLRHVLGLHAAECPPAQAGLYRSKQSYIATRPAKEEPDPPEDNDLSLTVQAFIGVLDLEMQ